jgi:CO/xanthine dehydrogenase Mo-binding subunit
MQMTKAAKRIGMDPWRIRLLNAYRNGDMRAHRRPVKDAALVETIQAAARISNNELADDCKAMTSWDREAG